MIPKYINEKVFWSYVNKTDNCWLWLKKSFAFSINGINYFRPNRVAYYLIKGIDPGLSSIKQICRNQLCVNPEHMILTDRRNPKLTRKQRDDILISNKSGSDLAKEYGVSRQRISQLRKKYGQRKD